MLGNAGTNILNNVVNGARTNTASSSDPLSSTTNARSSIAHFSILLGVTVFLLVMLCCIVCIGRCRIRRAHRRNQIRHLREYGPGPDVPNVVIELDVIHNAQSTENQNQCIDNKYVVHSRSSQENGGNSSNQVQSVFRLHDVFPG
ncbi:hypothetical protein [Ehrlichia japonica]|uniref:Uncharacterized protein n=1 Tax=Ehrlichia japonica TaxID=391036 RepID=X5GJN5_9RICK|nr:hypothetical protein [Ehrlichia japonica]AHX04658.1 hypothetical protein EHF_0213 [Ehrlichia japonica]